MLIPEYENYQESKKHGKDSFPYDTYLCTIPKDFHMVPLHWHDEMEMIYIKKGRGIISVDLVDYEVSDGSIIIILPGHLHSIRTEKLQTMEYENIIFSLDLLQSKQMDVCSTSYLMPLRMGKITVPVHFGTESDNYRDIADILDNCDHIGSEKPEAAEFFIKSQLLLLFYVLMNRCRMDCCNVVGSKKIDRMKAVLKYVEIHYAEKITIEEIAKEANCAPSYFMRMFREAIGSTFIEYLNDYRLTMSARLLKETEESVLEVAMGVGFDNLSYFNRCFKKKFQITPGKYRKEG